MVLVNRRTDDLDVPSSPPTTPPASSCAVGTSPASGTAGSRTWPARRPPPAWSGPGPSGSAMRGHGLPDDPALVVTATYWSEDEGAPALRQLLDAGTEFTAVVAGNDLIALGCYDVFAERGMPAPTT